MDVKVTQVQYSEKEVVFLLGYYLEYRSQLISPTAIPEDPCIEGGYVENHNWQHELPLGHSKSDYAWPYMVKSPATIKPDGKRRAVKQQDIHIAMVDLEDGLMCLTDNYLEIIYKYFLFQTHTLIELAREYNLNHHFMVQRRCTKAVETLTKHMNSGARPIKNV